MSPHHKLIYGATLEQIKQASGGQCVVTKPFKIYRCPMYGEPEQEDEDLQFVGIEYDRIYGIYEHSVSSPDKLQFHHGAGVSEQVKQQFHQTYPQVEGKCYAIIQDVYTSHYTYGTLVYGYWITDDYLNPVSQEDADIEDAQESCPLRDCGRRGWPKGHKSLFSAVESIYDTDHGGHNMHNYPSQYFYGATIDTLTTNEDSEACEQLAKQLQTCYKPVTIRSRDEILSELRTIIPTIELSETPVITLLQSMCYCCI